MIRVRLPHHLQTLAGCGHEVCVAVDDVTLSNVLEAVERNYPMLRGTIRDHITRKRRPRVRFFAAGEDISLREPDAALPDSIKTGDEPLMIVGAVSGG